MQDIDIFVQGEGRPMMSSGKRPYVSEMVGWRMNHSLTRPLHD
jgi:hypothetical protein